MSKVELVKKLPELLKDGLKVYKNLKADMEKALGLQRYGKKLDQINQIMDAVREHLNQEEKNVVGILAEARKLTEKGLQDAVVVVEVIKSQCDVLLGIINKASIKTATSKEKKDKLYLACVYFAQFAKDIDAKVTNAEKALLEASDKLITAKTKLTTVTDALERIQKDLVKELEKAKADERKLAYGWAAVGAILGPVGLAISYGIAAGVTEGHSIKQIENDFEEKRKEVNEYMDEFENMKAETDSLKRSVVEKKAALSEIHGELSKTSSLTTIEWGVIEPVAALHFEQVYKSAESLCEACKAFLKTAKA